MYSFVGDKIKYTREKRGLTQKQLGKMCGMGEAQIGKYERGERKAKLNTLTKIANALNTDITFFLDYNNFEEFSALINSKKVKSSIEEQFRYRVDKANLTHLVTILQEMGYSIMFDENEKIIKTIFIESDNTNKQDVDYNDILIDVSRDELLSIEKESDDFLKFKLNELIKQKINNSPSSDED